MSVSCEQLLHRYSHFDPDLLADPYPLFRQLRLTDPVHWSDFLDGWVLTRYADESSLLRDPRLSSNRQPSFMGQLPKDVLEEVRPLGHLFSAFVGLSDPPVHTRLRGLINKAFTARMVETWRPRIQEITDSLLDQVQQCGAMDAIRNLAYPLPAIVIAEMLGVPPQDRDQFKKWSDDFIAYIGTLRAVADRARQAQRSLFQMRDYLQEIINQLRRDPRENLMSALISVEEEGDGLNELELVAMCISLLAGGHETTTNLIGNGLLALLRHPDQMQKLRESPELIPIAVEELLRYDSSVQRIERIATADLEVAGKQVKKGQRLLLMLGAANRDPAQYPNPDALDVTRRPNQHLAFAAGAHFCVGAPLARAEIQIAISTLTRRFPGMQLADEPLKWHRNIAHRGLESLRVILR